MLHQTVALARDICKPDEFRNLFAHAGYDPD